MPNQPTYPGGHFALDIMGANAGYLKNFSSIEIVSNDLGPEKVANIKWTPGKATVGIGMGKELYEWIKAAFDEKDVTRSGSITSADFNYKAMAVQTFENALITSVTVPKLDGSSKDAAYFDVEFEAEQVRWSKGGGEDIRGKVGPQEMEWLSSNFRVEMGGLPCSRVASVDSFTFSIAREPTKHPAKVTVPDIKLSIGMADYQSWADAAKKWFVDGKHLEEHEMQGRIVFLNPNMKDEIGEITLLNCGFKKFSKDDIEANSEKIARFDVELYVEKMEFKLTS
jgi:hypothetical protein